MAFDESLTEAILPMAGLERGTPATQADATVRCGSRYRANEMSLRRRLEVGMQAVRLAVEMGGYPVELDYETLMYHAVAADDLEAVKKLQVRHLLTQC